MTDEHPDLKLARELIVPGAVWTAERVQLLKELVKRNELIGSPLGRKRYILARDMLGAVLRYRAAEIELAKEWNLTGYCIVLHPSKRGFWCFNCDRVSWHPYDVKYRFCGECKRSHP